MNWTITLDGRQYATINGNQTEAKKFLRTWFLGAVERIEAHSENGHHFILTWRTLPDGREYMRMSDQWGQYDDGCGCTGCLQGHSCMNLD